MQRIFYIIALVIGLLTVTNCQKKEEIPRFHVEISHPDNNYSVTPIKDSITTLEGISAGLPYGSTSGHWADSGKRWTEQVGTPIGADIVYYSNYEDVFYHLKAKFPVEYMKEMSHRAYFDMEPEYFEGELPKYIDIRKDPHYESLYNHLVITCRVFEYLIFGFAPKGMVVVWIGYGSIRIEVGRYQAELVTDEKLVKQYEDRLIAMYAITRERKREIYGRRWANATSELWDNYRKRYKLRTVISSAHKGFRLFSNDIEYFNGETETLLRPYVLSTEAKERAIPEYLYFIFETGKGASYHTKVFFDWERLHTILEKDPKGEHTLEIKLNATSDDLEAFLDGELIKTEGQYIGKNDEGRYVFRESYK